MVDIFIVDASSYDEVQQQLLKFRDNIKIVHTFQPRSPATNSSSQVQPNGKVEASNHSTGTSTPPQQTATSPPAVSVVTFRWDYGDIHERDKKRAR